MSRPVIKVREAIPHLHHNHSKAGLGSWAVRHQDDWEAAWAHCDRGYYLLAVMPALQFPKATTISVGVEVIRWTNRMLLERELTYRPGPGVAEFFGKVESGLDQAAPGLIAGEGKIEHGPLGSDQYWGNPWIQAVLRALHWLEEARHAESRLHEGACLHAIGMQVTKLLERGDSYRAWSAYELADVVRGLVPWAEVHGYVDDAVPPPQHPKDHGRWQANANRRSRPYSGPPIRRMCDASYATFFRRQKPPKSPIDGVRSIPCPICGNRMKPGSGPDWRKEGNKVRTEGPMYHFEVTK